MNKKTKEFNNRHGSVKVVFDGYTYSVEYVMYSNYKTGRPQFTKIWAHMDDAVKAGDYFNAAKDELKGKPWVEPIGMCTFANRKACVCKGEHCPKVLGGEAYWEIFRASCPHRQK